MKRNHLKHIAAAVMLLGTAASGTALAQYGRDVGNFNGAYNSSWYVLGSYDWIDPDSRFGTNDKGDGGGIRLGKVLSPSWDVQFGPTFSRVNDDNGRYKQNTFGVDALYLFSRERFRPFLLIGGGAQQDEISGPFGSEKHTSPFVNAGLGFQYSFTDQLGMQLDYRRMYAKLHDSDFGFSHSNTDVVTLGITYAFSKRVVAPVRVSAPPPAPVPPIAAAPATPPAPPPPPPPPRFERYTLAATDLFDFDSATLRMPQPKLDEIASALAANPQIANVAVTGYTDRLGSQQYNMGLSQRRADAVKGYLVGKGISSSRLVATGRGETNPVVQCHDRNRAQLIACLQPNRRVEVEQIVVERRVQ